MFIAYRLDEGNFCACPDHWSATVNRRSSRPFSMKELGVRVSFVSIHWFLRSTAVLLPGWLSWLAKGEVNSEYTYLSYELVCVDFANSQLSSTYRSHTNSNPAWCVSVSLPSVKQRTLSCSKTPPRRTPECLIWPISTVTIYKSDVMF